MIAGIELGQLQHLAEPKRRAEAAKQFEAMLVEHLLKTMRPDTPTDPETEALSGSQTYRDLADQQLAQALAASGGLGIAKMILQHLHEPKK